MAGSSIAAPGAIAWVTDFLNAAYYARDDDERRAYGVGFPTVAERRAFRPERRLEDAALGPLTPPLRSPEEQDWSTYDPVTLPNPDGALSFLAQPERWPDIGCANGRFTPLRSTGLAGQTFEIEVVAEPAPRSPVFTRGYVTCTELHFGDGREGERLPAATSELSERYRAGAARRDAKPSSSSGALSRRTAACSLSWRS
jgi:hypothetical protein